VSSLDSFHVVYMSSQSQSKMKDQGKISELNQSSHRYQSSNTVGRMSETYEPQGFLGLKVNTIKPDSPSSASMCDDPLHRTGLQRTHSRKARRVRAKQRERERILANLGANASREEKQWALYPKAMKQRTDADRRKQERIAKHAAYVDFMKEYVYKYGSHKIFIKEDYDAFCKYYDNPTQFPKSAMYEDILLRYNQYRSNRFGAKPAVNLSQFPRANIPAISQYPSLTHISNSGWKGTPPQLGMPDYDPEYDQYSVQAGSVPSIPEPPLYTPQSGVLEACESVSNMVEEIVASAAFSQLTDLCTFKRPLFSIVVLSLVTLALQVFRYTVLTVNFLSGLLLGMLYGNSRSKYPYVPHSSPLSSDDGAAFTGRKTVSSVRPASASAPGISVTATQGWGMSNRGAPKQIQKIAGASPQPRITPPKAAKKDPFDGKLSGFGVGI